MARKLLKILLVVLATGLGLAGVVLIRVWIGSRDLPSAQDDDMKLSRTAIPPAQNAFAHIQDAAGKLHWEQEHEELVKGVLAGGNTHSAAITELLLQNQDALAALERALELRRLQVPEEGTDGNIAYSLLAWRRLAQLLCLRARASYNAGKVSAAFDDALRLLRLGHMVEGAGDLITHLMGNGFKTMGLEQVRHFLPAKHLRSRELKQVVAQLESLRPKAGDFRQALQLDYTFMASTIDVPGQFSEGNEGRFRGEMKAWEYLEKGSVLSRYIYKKNATKKLFADRYREIAASWEKSYSQVQLTDPDPATEKNQYKLLATLWEPNIVGRIIFSIGMPSKSPLAGKCRLQTEISATQLLVALRAHQLNHGTLPPSMEPLIPDYLPSTPTDDFDGRPLRYSPERKIVYSVGQNLIDERGNRDKDVAFDIAF